MEEWIGWSAQRIHSFGSEEPDVVEDARARKQPDKASKETRRQQEIIKRRGTLNAEGNNKWRR